MNILHQIPKGSASAICAVLTGLLMSSGTCRAAESDAANYVDPRIGNIAPFLVPTFPTIQQPNQMLRMHPIRDDYTIDQVQYFPLQIMGHRNTDILQMRVSLGTVNSADWERKMAYDHDLEVVHPWLYETCLVEDDITIGFTPGRKAAVYRYQFPVNPQKNILIEGTDKMTGALAGSNAVNIRECITYKSKNADLKPVTVSVWCYAEVTDDQGKPAAGMEMTIDKNRLCIKFGQETPKTVLLKYAISYVSREQAKKNFDAEVANQNFDEVAATAKAAWGVVFNKIRVNGGTDAQKRSFYTALYRVHGYCKVVSVISC